MQEDFAERLASLVSWDHSVCLWSASQLHVACRVVQHSGGPTLCSAPWRRKEGLALCCRLLSPAGAVRPVWYCVIHLSSVILRKIIFYQNVETEKNVPWPISNYTNKLFCSLCTLYRLFIVLQYDGKWILLSCIRLSLSQLSCYNLRMIASRAVDLQAALSNKGQSEEKEIVKGNRLRLCNTETIWGRWWKIPGKER